MRCFLLLALLYGNLSAAKIGVFTAAFSNSQIIFNIRIAESLAEAGHDVVLIRPEFNPQSTSIKPKNPKIREIHTKAAPIDAFEHFSEIEHREVFEGLGYMELMDFSNAYKNLTNEACRVMLTNDEFLEKIRAEKIDLAFHHHIDFCQHGIAHYVGIKKWVSTMPGPPHLLILRDLGIPYYNSFTPNLLQNATLPMTFVDRLKAVTGMILLTVLGKRQVDDPQTAILRSKFGQDFPSVTELRKTAKINFVNADPFLEYQFPSTQKIQYIGGIGTKDSKPLQEPFKSFVEKAKKVVLVSFGSVVVAKEMPLHWKNSLLELFRRNPDISFVWKFEESIEVPANVIRTKWLPQNDLLAHEKTIGFITHGGYNSLGEAVQSGTPCVFMPLFADQYRNSMLAQYRGIGLQLPKEQLSADSLNEKLHQILDDPKYTATVKKFQALAKGRLNSPDEVLRYWTNLVLNHDVDLNLPELSTVELYNLDVYGFFALMLLVFALVLRTLFRLYYWSCCTMAYKEKVKLQ